jgi:hypothetical protein
VARKRFKLLSHISKKYQPAGLIGASDKGNRDRERFPVLKADKNVRWMPIESHLEE